MQTLISLYEAVDRDLIVSWQSHTESTVSKLRSFGCGCLHSVDSYGDFDHFVIQTKMTCSLWDLTIRYLVVLKFNHSLVKDNYGRSPIALISE